MSYSDILSHAVAYLEPYVTFIYSELCHIQNPGIFRTRDNSELCQDISLKITSL